MSSRVVYNGRVLFQTPGWRGDTRPGVRSFNKAGEPIDDTPIVMDDVSMRNNKGVPYRDPDDGIVYRIVHRLDLREGWGTSAFWLARFHVTWDVLVEWIERGWFDAAMEQGSPTKRFRCRDERKVLEYLEINPATLLSKPARTRRSRSSSKTRA